MILLAQLRLGEFCRPKNSSQLSAHAKAGFSADAEARTIAISLQASQSWLDQKGSILYGVRLDMADGLCTYEYIGHPLTCDHSV